jgi:poly-gamma-glutamate synthesis protein (capsule biosynthesis protein)
MSGYVEILPLTEAERAAMRGVCWHRDPRCPELDELVCLRMPLRGFGGERHIGELVVAASVAEPLRWVFERLYAARYPIERMERIERFGGDDARSMAANNSSAFNFRSVDGEERLSMHALGCAVDLNPVQNPWVRGARVDPTAGRAFLDRSANHPAVIRRPGPVTDAFDAIGWEWGGDWSAYCDYHHFQRAVGTDRSPSPQSA